MRYFQHYLSQRVFAFVLVTAHSVADHQQRKLCLVRITDVSVSRHAAVP